MGTYIPDMQSLRELGRQVMELPDADRAALASDLLDSLPAVLSDADEGLAEALRRDTELDRDPTAAMTLDDLRRALGRS